MNKGIRADVKISDFRILNEKILLKSLCYYMFFCFVKSQNSRRGHDFDIILACKEFILSLKLFFTHHARTPYKLQFYSVVNQATLIRLMMVQTRAAENVKPVKRQEWSPVQSRAARKPSSGIQLWSATVSLAHT